MRSILPAVAVVAALAWAGPAQAQYGNSGLGLSLGYFGLNESTAFGINSAVPLGLEASRYLEDGWETYAHLQLMITKERVTNSSVVGVAPAVGIRYLLHEEGYRPYLGLDLS